MRLKALGQVLEVVSIGGFNKIDNERFVDSQNTISTGLLKKYGQI